jgi:hypothetical protein
VVANIGAWLGGRGWISVLGKGGGVWLVVALGTCCAGKVLTGMDKVCCAGCGVGKGRVFGVGAAEN